MKGIKRVGVGLLAVVVVAVLAAPASAQNYQAPGHAPFTIKGTQKTENIISIESGLTMKCKNTTYYGSMSSNFVQSLALNPTFEGCTWLGIKAEVTTTGCSFVFAEPKSMKGSLSISCEAGKAIKLVAANCEATFGSQSLEGLVSYTNIAGSPGTVSADFKLSGLTYTKTKDGVACPLNGLGTSSDGAYSGSQSLSAFEAATQRDFAIH